MSRGASYRWSRATRPKRWKRGFATPSRRSSWRRYKSLRAGKSVFRPAPRAGGLALRCLTAFQLAQRREHAPQALSGVRQFAEVIMRNFRQSLFAAGLQLEKHAPAISFRTPAAHEAALDQ